jgi:hypothetical protein
MWTKNYSLLILQNLYWTKSKLFTYLNLFVNADLYFLPRFRPNAVKSIIQTILNEELSGKQYDAEQSPVWCRSIADKIKNKIKGCT